VYSARVCNSSAAVEPPNRKCRGRKCRRVEPTNTQARMGDHRLRCAASEIETSLSSPCEDLGLTVATGPSFPSSVPPEWIPALARDLSSMQALHSGCRDHSAPVHALVVNAINQALGISTRHLYFTHRLKNPRSISGHDWRTCRRPARRKCLRHSDPRGRPCLDAPRGSGSARFLLPK